MRYEDYSRTAVELKALRSSMLKPLKRSPAHMLAYLEEPMEETDALRIGKHVHMMIERPSEFMEQVMLMPKFTGKTKEGKESERSKEALDKKAEWLESLPQGAVVVSEDDYKMYMGIMQRINSKKFAKRLLKEAVHENSLFVKDKETGVTLACRPDFITNRGHVCDIKTSVSADMDYFYGQIFRDNRMSQFYILQAAHYSHCIREAGIGDGKLFIFVVIEKAPPYGIAVYTVDEGHLDVGERWRKHLTRMYADCLSSGVWDDYPDEAQSFDLPTYASMPPMEE